MKLTTRFIFGLSAIIISYFGGVVAVYEWRIGLALSVIAGAVLAVTFPKEEDIRSDEA